MFTDKLTEVKASSH